MDLIEPILNRFFRRRMRSFLERDEAVPVVLRPKAASDRAEYLLYIHIPFCGSLCPYCSFHRCEYKPPLADRYFPALWKEMRMYRDLGHTFKALYCGGGTPTIQMDYLEETLGRARADFGIREISVETNPNHLTDAMLGRLKRAGVNRLSVGVQSFDDEVLKALGRLEKYGSGGEIRERLAGAMGRFDTLNIDLIFNIPTQSEASLSRDLDMVEALGSEQVTFYPLMTAPSVASLLKGRLGPMDYGREKRYYKLILDRMKNRFRASTAWCFSSKASMIDEYIIDYDHYVGVGSGAFGFHNGRLHLNTFSMTEYLLRIERGQWPITRVKRFSPKELLYYFLLRRLFGLRLPRQELLAELGRNRPAGLGIEMFLLRLCRAIGHAGGTIELTDRGKYYWVMAMREFFIAVDTMRDHCRGDAARQDGSPTSTPALAIG